MKNLLLPFGIGVVIGLILFQIFLRPEVETTYVETIKETTDTVFIHQFDTVYLTRKEIRHQVIRDTIMEPYTPQIKAFKATFPLTYGNAFLTGEVLGEVLKTSLTTDFEIPVITNTIEKEKITTIIKKPTGFYAVGGVNSNFNYSVGVNYLRDNSLIGYKYTPQLKIHSLEVGFRLLGK